jgi:hypothetical protein
MTAAQIISEIKGMSLIDKIQIIEFAIKSIKKETSKKLSLSKAAMLLKKDYENDSELTVFSNLDGEDFYETR